MEEFDIDHPVGGIVKLDAPLNFPDEDKRTYAWLRRKVRHYLIERELGRGGYSVAYLAHPCNSSGTPIVGSPAVVLKLPNLQPGFSHSAESRHLGSGEIKDREEWVLTRRKLLRCDHANTIFDLGIKYRKEENDQLSPDSYSITVQLFLSDADPLNEWLQSEHLRPKIYPASAGELIDNWMGIPSWDDWFPVVLSVADALVDIHQRRVIHGDIWPANVYIRGKRRPHVIFIDFGESFGATPSGNPRLQKDHPYRAPERDRPEYVPTEQVDVYSFGKLMLYLTIGIDIRIPSGNHGLPLLYGHERREFLRNEILQRNPSLLKARPEVLDLIAQCTEVDPVVRPSMLEVRDQLLSVTKVSRILRPEDLSSRLRKAANRVSAFPDALSQSNDKNIFLGFIEKKITEIEQLLKDSETEMVEVTGTRDVLLSALVSLFQELSQDDSWSTFTTPSVWQANALGLGGRYATATINAVRRNAAVHRTYVVSVEELGFEWTCRLAERLMGSKTSALVDLGERFDAQTRLCKVGSDKTHSSFATSPRVTEAFVEEHRERFILVLESLVTMVDKWDLGPNISHSRSVQIGHTKGLFLGLTPVCQVSDIQKLRSINPVSLMHFSAKAPKPECWLLVMTDVRGRNEVARSNGLPYLRGAGLSAPELRKVRVFRSAFGKPNSRIKGLEELMSSSVNIGSSLAELSACLRS